MVARERPLIRVLDPRTAPQVPGRPPKPTLYYQDRLLVTVSEGKETEIRQQIAAVLGGEVLETDSVDRRRRRVPRRGRAGAVVLALGLRKAGPAQVDANGQPAARATTGPEATDAAMAPVDAWEALQELRRAGVEGVHLEHVVRPANDMCGTGGYWGGIGGYWGGIGGYWGGIGGYWGGIAAQGIAEYGIPGRGGRMPVALTIADPARTAKTLQRPPVVAVVDGEIDHPWFRDDTRLTRLELDGSGTLVAAQGDPRDHPSFQPVNDLTNERHNLECHGTFIAGLVRQGCPEAHIVSVPVMDGDGIAAESDVVAALTGLLERHLAGQEDEAKRDQVIDVLTLSLGYYAEDETYDSGPVATVLKELADAGVLVVAAVGNDASRDHFVPAVLANQIDTSGVASVGALNPNGSTIALFSNQCDPVTVYRTGVALVSTVPRMNAGGNPTVEGTGDGDRRRTSMDPDDYTGGFAAWSGTSFAAPVFAADLARHLASLGDELVDVSAATMRSRAQSARAACLEEVPQ